MSGIYAIAVPKWGIEMVEGTINSWLKAAGDAVNKGDEILEIESDKIVNVWEAPADGVLRRLLVEEGEARAVGQLLGVIAAAEVSDADIDAFIAGYAERGDTATAPETKATSGAAPAQRNAASVGASADTGRASPVVKRLAQELGVDLAQVSGSGRNGRITQDDVRAVANGTAAAAQPADADDYRDLPLSATRKTIAQRLTAAKQEIPHYYLSVDWEVDALMAKRRALNAEGEAAISLNDMLVYCVARALMAVPDININVLGDTVRQFTCANVAIAIATGNGLYPATIRAAESLSVAEIATQRATLVERAESGGLTRDDLSDASFTVSNLGMYGIDRFTAIINPPMGAILAVGAARESCVARDGQVSTATVLSATLSCDHRVIDGATGARFLQALREEIEKLAA
jgi:pyruvate dehydrogenase E2 component (dihydrolipoamide acetyltransferase)